MIWPPERPHSVDKEVLGIAAATHVASGGEVGGHAVGRVHSETVEAHAHAVQPVYQLARIVVHGGLIGHCAVETVVFGHEVLAHDSQHTRFVEHGVLIVSSQRIVRLQLRFRRRDARVGHRHRAAGKS